MRRRRKQGSAAGAVGGVFILVIIGACAGMFSRSGKSADVSIAPRPSRVDARSDPASARLPHPTPAPTQDTPVVSVPRVEPATRPKPASVLAMEAASRTSEAAHLRYDDEARRAAAEYDAGPGVSLNAQVRDAEVAMAGERANGTPQDRVAAIGRYNTLRDQLVKARTSYTATRPRATIALNAWRSAYAAWQQAKTVAAPDLTALAAAPSVTEQRQPAPTATTTGRPAAVASADTGEPGYYSGPSGYGASGRLGGGYPSGGGDKPVHVREYTKKDGTHVQSHDRAAPGTGGGRRK